MATAKGAWHAESRHSRWQKVGTLAVIVMLLMLLQFAFRYAFEVDCQLCYCIQSIIKVLMLQCVIVPRTPSGLYAYCKFSSTVLKKGFCFDAEAITT